MQIFKYSLKSFLYILALMLLDLLVLKISLGLAFYIRTNFFPNFFPLLQEGSSNQYSWIILLIFFTLVNEKIYFMRYDYWGDLKRILKGLFFSFVAVFTLLTLTKMSIQYSRSFLILFFLIVSFLLPVFKRIIKQLLFSIKTFKVNVKVVAKGEQYKKITSEINNNWYFGFTNDEEHYEMVLIGSKEFDVDELQKIIKKYSKQTKDIYVIPYIDHIDFTYTTVMNFSNIRLSAIHLENRLLNLKSVLIKNLFEKALILLSSPVVLLMHLIISILIRIDSTGPIIFKQKRFGKDAKPYSCYKYRTMYKDNNEILQEYLNEHPEEIKYYSTYHKYKNDPRITKIGNFLRKTSLDELSQFFNVLRGDMNLIGPRPYMLSEQEKIGSSKEEIIFAVKPGITGLWQVSGRNELTFQERIKLDKWYIQNWSLWLDFVIFLKTIKVVLLKVGAK